MISVAVDIDNTLRDFSGAVEKWIEIDHPDKSEMLLSVQDSEYRSLDAIFDTHEEVHDWMYDERVFQIFGSANRVHSKIMDQLNALEKVSKSNGFKLTIASVQRERSVSATLWWLAKFGCRVQDYKFFNTMQDKIDYGFDVYIDDSPEVLEALVERDKEDVVWNTHPQIHDIPHSIPSAIKIPYGYNDHIDVPILDVRDGKFNDIYEMLNIK